MRGVSRGLILLENVLGWPVGIPLLILTLHLDVLSLRWRRLLFMLRDGRKLSRTISLVCLRVVLLSLEFIDWHRIYLVVGSYLNVIKFTLVMGSRYHFIDSGFPLVSVFLLDLVGHLLLLRPFSKVLPFLKILFRLWIFVHLQIWILLHVWSLHVVLHLVL